MPRRIGSHQRIRCKTCNHAERGRIDYLLAGGSAAKPIAARFGLKSSSVYNHSKLHISAEYRASVRVGPFGDEAALRDLCNKHGGSVIENLAAIYSTLASRFLNAFEIGDDPTLSLLTQRMHKNLELRAKLTHELMPSSTTINNNTNVAVFQNPQYLEAIGSIAAALRQFPEARLAVAATLRNLSGAGDQLLIEGTGTNVVPWPTR